MLLGRMVLQAFRGFGLGAAGPRGPQAALLARVQASQVVHRHHVTFSKLHCAQLQRPLAAAAAAAVQPWRLRAPCLAGSSQQQRLGARGTHAAAAAAQQADGEENSSSSSSSDDDDEGEEDDEDADVIGELGEAEGEEPEWEELEDSMAPQTSTGGAPWGEAALEVAQRLLAGGPGAPPELAGVQLFSLRAIPANKRLDIRLDKMTDRYGSPSLEDVAAFARAFSAAYEEALGEAAAGEVELEVSSPGAERQVRVPGELPRFAELPMRVEYALEDDKVESKVFTFAEYDAAAGLTRWRLADVRANREAGGKGRGLNRKQRDAVIELPLASLRRVNLYIDF